MRGRLILTLLSLTLLPWTATAQKRMLQHEDFDTWREIERSAISSDGKHVLYHLEPGKGDMILKVKQSDGSEVATIERGENARFTYDGQYVVFVIKPALEEVNELRRKKTKKDDLPKDSLGILDLSTGEITRIPRVRGYRLAAKASDYLFYELEEAAPDTTKTKKNGKKPSRWR